MLRSCLTIIGLLWVTFNSQAQIYTGENNYAPPSPNPYSLAMLSQTRVNQHCGTADVTVPIVDLTSRRLKVPITLNYNTGGNKVQDVASWVGLGWSMDAGGLITRIVRGLPDEQENGFCEASDIGEKAYLAYNNDYIGGVSANTYDGEPDLFFFSFMGISGQFILDEDGVPILLPYGNLKIKPGICPLATEQSWTITDDSGNRYVFGKTASSRESSRFEADTDVDMTFISSWYLSEIVTPNADDLIQFLYASTPSYQYKYFVQDILHKTYNYSPWVDNCVNDPGDLRNRDLTVTVVNPLYPSAIISQQGRVEFLMNAASRLDIPGAKSLSKILIKDNNFNEVASYSFQTSYFVSDGCSTAECKRLKLDAVVRDAGTRNILQAGFKYNTLNLPARSSHQVDHWGYYNSNADTMKIAALVVGGSCPQNYTGANRGADSVRSKANILTSLHEATGGFTEYVYEGHVYSADATTNALAGGTRLKKMKKCFENGNCIPTQYDYTLEGSSISSGKINSLPEYYFQSKTHVFTPTSYTPPAGFVVVTHYLIRTSNSLVDLFNILGYHVGYSRVVERTPGLGSVESFFTNENGHADDSPVINGYSAGVTGTQLNMYTSPFPPKTSKVYERGLLTLRKVKREDGKLLKVTSYDYDFEINTFKRQIPGVKTALVGNNNYYGPTYQVGKYYHISRPYLVVGISETSYDQLDPGNEAKKLVQYIDYSYIPYGQTGIAADLQPRQIINTLPNGDKRITVNKYVNDYDLPGFDASDSDPESYGLKLLQDKNVSNSLIESITYMQIGTVNYFAVGSLNVFKDFGGNKPYLYKQFKSRSNSTQFTNWQWSESTLQAMGDFVQARFDYAYNFYKVGKTYNTYDAYGNPLSITRDDGIEDIYSWTYNNSLINASMQNPGTFEHKTSLVHKPLVGPLAITDANNVGSFYEYDAFTRLRLIRKHNNDITTRYRYHYQTENPEMPTTNIARTGCTMQAISQSFNAAVNLEGTTTYEWDFGDGTSLINTTGLATHTYSLTGSYTVKVTRTNPEYFNSSKSQTVVIITAPITEATICVSGIVVYDACGVDSPSTSSCGPPGGVEFVGENINMPVEEGILPNYATPGGGVTPPTLSVTANGSVSSYSWQYRFNGGSWSTFSSSSFVSGPPGFGTGSIGSWEVVCVLTDACGNTFQSNPYFFSCYKSSNCF